MNLLPKALSITFILLTFSCNSKKNIADPQASNPQKEMIEAGFKKATILHSDIEGDCPYVLAIENEDLLFDPINLESNYKSANIQVWVKFHPLRMANRCDKANPVEIIEIKKA